MHEHCCCNALKSTSCFQHTHFTSWWKLHKVSLIYNWADIVIILPNILLNNTCCPTFFWKVREHKISKTQSELHDRKMAFLSCSIIWGVNDAPQPHQGMLIQSCVSEREGTSPALSSLIPRVWSHLLLCTSPNHQAWQHVRACPSNCCQVKFCN